MKKILLILSACVFTMPYCSKEDDKVCWDCKTKGTIIAGGFGSSFSVDTTICDRPPEEMKKYENGYSSTETNNGVTAVTVTTCKIR